VGNKAAVILQLGAKVLDERSLFPIIGGVAQIGGERSEVTAQGRTGALTLPYGAHVMTIRASGRRQYVTNIVVSTGTPTYPVYLSGYSPEISGFLYGTGCEIVTNAQIQVVNEKTQNIVQRYNLDGVPFYTIHLGAGQKTNLRVRPKDYDNQNYSFTPEASSYKDFVLTPEPALLTLVILALALAKRRNLQS